VVPVARASTGDITGVLHRSGGDRHARATSQKHDATNLGLRAGAPPTTAAQRGGDEVLLQLRIALPDRPGSLARVSRVLGALGADIRSVTVLDHGGARVVDEFTVAWPSYPGSDRLMHALGAIPGVTLEGAWRTTSRPDAFPDLDVLLQVKEHPERGLQTLVDALPGVFSADWAVVLGAPPERPTLAASPTAPLPGGLPDIRPTHPLAFSSGPATHLAAVPAGAGTTAYLARTDGGPAFHRVELARLARLVEVAVSFAQLSTRGRVHLRGS
jgi:hypothetical protein